MTEQLMFDFMITDNKELTDIEPSEDDVQIEEPELQENEDNLQEFKDALEAEDAKTYPSGRVYYPINEKLAEHAHYMNSMSDYKKGSTEAAYKGYCDECYDLAERVAKERPKSAEKAWYKAHKYAYKLAKWFNDTSRNEASCPSVLVSGPANFPVKKKNRQNSRRDSLHKEWEAIQNYKEQVRNMIYATETIRSDEDDAVEQIKDKIARLEADQERMKKVNTYYRKHKTVKGCEGITDENAERIMAAIHADWRGERALPYNSYMLTNNNQNIHRLKDRLKSLESVKEKGSSEEDCGGLFKVVRNAEMMRLQLLFDGKPDDDTRSILKRHGFKFAPSQSAWQRNLNGNGEYALKMVKRDLGIEV